MTWQQYGSELEGNLGDLSARLQRGACRTKAVRRVFIPKGDGRQRPLGVTALEDKIVQRATTEVLNAIYETDFLEFGPFAAENRRRRGQGKPETFDFLGFTHICGRKRSNGRFTVLRQTMGERLQAKLGQVKAELRGRLHDPVPEVGKWLRSVVGGHLRYYGVPMNSPALALFRYRVAWLWYRSLRRRSQKTRLTWERMQRLVARWLPAAHVYHPYPLRRLGVIPEVGARCGSSARRDLWRG